MNILNHMGGTPLVALSRVGQGSPVPALVERERGATMVEGTAGNTGLGWT